jgi:hypothetical protein
MERKLDRLVDFDEASRNYPVRRLLGDSKPLRSYTWSCQNWLDQGWEGACVGFSMAHELSARPARVDGITEDDARAIYNLARQLDPWEGEDYEGTSVLAGMKALQDLHPNKILEYRWAFGLQDVLETIGHLGPVVLGINWYEGMFETDEKHFVHVEGEIAGGHAILAHGVNVRDRFVRLHNSWGKGWGMNGKCWISWDDLDRLLNEYGEACIPTWRRK